MKAKLSPEAAAAAKLARAGVRALKTRREEVRAEHRALAQLFATRKKELVSAARRVKKLAERYEDERAEVAGLEEEFDLEEPAEARAWAGIEQELSELPEELSIDWSADLEVTFDEF